MFKTWRQGAADHRADAATFRGKAAAAKNSKDRGEYERIVAAAERLAARCDREALADRNS